MSSGAEFINSAMGGAGIAILNQATRHLLYGIKQRKDAGNKLTAEDQQSVDFVDSCLFDILWPFAVGLIGGSVALYGFGEGDYQTMLYGAIPVAGESLELILKLVRRPKKPSPK